MCWNFTLRPPHVPCLFNSSTSAQVLLTPMCRNMFPMVRLIYFSTLLLLKLLISHLKFLPEQKYKFCLDFFWGFFLLIFYHYLGNSLCCCSNSLSVQHWEDKLCPWEISKTVSLSAAGQTPHRASWGLAARLRGQLSVSMAKGIPVLCWPLGEAPGQPARL